MTSANASMLRANRPDEDEEAPLASLPEIDQQLARWNETLTMGTVVVGPMGVPLRNEDGSVMRRPLNVDEQIAVNKQIGELNKQRAKAGQGTHKVRTSLESALRGGNPQQIMKAAEAARQTGAITQEQYDRIEYNYGGR